MKTRNVPAMIIVSMCLAISPSIAHAEALEMNDIPRTSVPPMPPSGSGASTRAGALGWSFENFGDGLRLSLADAGCLFADGPDLASGFAEDRATGGEVAGRQLRISSQSAPRFIAFRHETLREGDAPELRTTRGWIDRVSLRTRIVDTFVAPLHRVADKTFAYRENDSIDVLLVGASGSVHTASGLDVHVSCSHVHLRVPLTGNAAATSATVSIMGEQEPRRVALGWSRTAADDSPRVRFTMTEMDSQPIRRRRK